MFRLDQTEYFIAIVDEMSLSKAANRLYVSQSALSQYVAKLESSLDTKLFIRRNNNSLELTEAGTLLYQSAKEIEKIQNDFQNKLNSMQNEQNRKITFGCTGERGIRTLAYILPLLFEKNPGFQIHVVQASMLKLQSMLHDEEIDIVYGGINKSCLFENNSNIEHRILHNGTVDLAVPRTHPLFDQGSDVAGESVISVSLRDFKNAPFVLLKNSTVLRQTLNSYFKSIDFSPIIQLELDKTLSTLSVIKTGAMLGLCPWGYKQEGVHFIRIEPPIQYSFAVFYRKDRIRLKQMQNLINSFADSFLNVII